MRLLGVDCGRKRIGLALSDPTAVLASPWMTVPAGESPEASASDVAGLLERARDPLDDESAVAEVVVGLPRRLDGSENDQTQYARRFAAAIGARTGLTVHVQDERLTSRDAESRLAEREPDWRARKTRLDAAAAAIILQDFLDHRSRLVEPSARLVDPLE